MKVSDYWREAVDCALDEAGIVASAEQAAAIARSIEISHDNIGMAFGHPTSDGRDRDVKQLEGLLQEERDKRVCPECRGAGTITTNGPYHSAISQCDRCRGTGKIK